MALTVRKQQSMFTCECHGAAGAINQLVTLATCNLRQHMYVAVGRNRLKQRVLINLSVNRDGQAFEVGFELWKPLRQEPKQLADVGGVDGKLGDAARVLLEIADEGDLRHLDALHVKRGEHDRCHVRPCRLKHLT